MNTIYKCRKQKKKRVARTDFENLKLGYFLKPLIELYNSTIKVYTKVNITILTEEWRKHIISLLFCFIQPYSFKLAYIYNYTTKQLKRLTEPFKCI